MHEIKLAEDLVNILNKEVSSPEVGKVKTVYLEVGKLRYIVPEIMRSCFVHIPKDKKLEEAEINIKILPIKIKCKKCKTERVVDNGIYVCETCLSEEAKLISGNEFMVKGIEW